MYVTCRVCRGRGYVNYSSGPDAVCNLCAGEGRVFMLNPEKPQPVPSLWVRFLRWLNRS